MCIVYLVKIIIISEIYIHIPLLIFNSPYKLHIFVAACADHKEQCETDISDHPPFFLNDYNISEVIFLVSPLILPLHGKIML